MKITFFIGGLSGGGAERVVCNLANFMSDKGNDCTILTMAEDKNSYGLKDTVKTQSLIKNDERQNLLIDNVKRILRLHRFIRTQGCDAYVVCLPITIILFLLFRKATGAKVIVSERADPSRYSWWIQSLLKKLAKRADVWVFQTDDARQWYGDRVKKAIVIPNAINEDFIRPVYQGERRKVIVGAGRLSAQKNFALLINAFADISDAFPDYHLEIYGEGDERSAMERLAKERGVADRVTMPGYVSCLGEKIQDASLFILSSDFEGMPNALMEAMALGLPCISTDCPVGGPKFLISHGENGLLVPTGDRNRLAKAMRSLLSYPLFARKIGDRASEVRDTLNPDRIYGMWDSVIGSTINR